MPTSSIDDIVEIDSAKPTRFENNEIIHYKGGILPLLRLSRYFRFAGDDPDLSYALVVDAGNGPVGIVVDRLPGQREIVVHSIKDPLLQVPGVAGATELGDKTVVLILDVKAIIRMNPDRK
ncbi:MAG: chemotaxis protein CheW [Syntrophobacteraceae bacterium]